MITRLSRVLPFCFVLFAIACGDPGLQEIPGGDKPGNTEKGYKLEIVTPMPMVLQTSSTALLTVRLTQNDLGVSGANVAFAVNGASGGSRVGALRSATSGTGEASVEIIAGVEEASFRVAMESQYTNLMYANIQVRAANNTGTTVTVTIAYPDQTTQPIQSATISVYEGTITCDTLLTSATPPTALVGPQELTDINGQVVFNGVTGGTQISVLAVGKNVNQATVADGCVAATDVVLGQDNPVMVSLAARTLRLEGTYDYSTELNMVNAIPGLVGDVITEIAAITDDPNDPGLYLVQKVEEFTGPWPGFLESAAADAVNNLITSYLPETFLNWLTWIGDAARVVTHLTLEGTLTIADDGAGGLEATEVWQNVVFTWRGACDPTTAPLCDQRRIALRNTRIGEQTMVYPVTRDNLVYRVADHQRSVPYVRFFHLFLLQVVYPELVPGATNTSQILAAAIDCVAVAEWVEEVDGNNDGKLVVLGLADFSVAQLDGYCQQGLSAIGALIDGKIDKLANALNSTVNMSGAAEIIDLDADLLVDKLQNGVWNGTIDVDGTPETVTGSFDASRN